VHTVTRAGVVIGDSQLEASIEGIGEKGDGMLKLPEVLGVAEARGEIAHVLEEVEKGRTFIIKGTKGREALVINADVFRRLQDAYLELVGELETTKILSDERAMRALQESSGERSRRLYSLSEVEGMIAEVEDVEGEQP
jgi:PHD/YefM family antitoxin component YafN of YafNO toxin-antitoxin module